MKIKIEIDTDDWKDLELIEKFMMDILPADDGDGGDDNDNNSGDGDGVELEKSGEVKPLPQPVKHNSNLNEKIGE